MKICILIIAGIVSLLRPKGLSANCVKRPERWIARTRARQPRHHTRNLGIISKEISSRKLVNSYIIRVTRFIVEFWIWAWLKTRTQTYDVPDVSQRSGRTQHCFWVGQKRAPQEQNNYSGPGALCPKNVWHQREGLIRHFCNLIHLAPNSGVQTG